MTSSNILFVYGLFGWGTWVEPFYYTAKAYKRKVDFYYKDILIRSFDADTCVMYCYFEKLGSWGYANKMATDAIIKHIPIVLPYAEYYWEII